MLYCRGWIQTACLQSQIEMVIPHVGALVSNRCNMEYKMQFHLITTSKPQPFTVEILLSWRDRRACPEGKSEPRNIILILVLILVVIALWSPEENESPYPHWQKMSFDILNYFLKDTDLFTFWHGLLNTISTASTESDICKSDNEKRPREFKETTDVFHHMMISPVHWHDKEELNGTQTAIRSLQFAILALNMLYGLKFKEEIEITEESPKAVEDAAKVIRIMVVMHIRSFHRAGNSVSSLTFRRLQKKWMEPEKN